jgi:hypothetical protein
MKTRTEVARFIEQQFEFQYDCGLPKTATHYGRQELRALMDFLYNDEPQNENEKINGANTL